KAPVAEVTGRKKNLSQAVVTSAVMAEHQLVTNENRLEFLRVRRDEPDPPVQLHCIDLTSSAPFVRPSDGFQGCDYPLGVIVAHQPSGRCRSQRPRDFHL